MKKKLFAVPMAFGLALAIASCNEAGTTSTKKTVDTTTQKQTETTTTTATTSTKEAETYTIKVYDIDDSLIGEKVVDLSENLTVHEALDKYFDATISGGFITSINNNVKDNKYFIFIYENGVSASVGLDGLVAQKGDVFEFKTECGYSKALGYGDMDEYDILVDKVIYHYLKGKYLTTTNASKSYTESTFWQAMETNLMLANGYDSSLFEGAFSEEYKESIINADLNDLPNATPSWPTAANYAKWYYGARYFDLEDNADFKEAFTNYLEGLTSYSEYAEPFTLSIAKEMGLEDKIPASIKNTTYRAELTYGIDGLIWQLTELALYNELSDSELSVFNLNTINEQVETNYADPAISVAEILLPLAAMNKNAREYMLTEEKDVIEYLFDNHFDRETYQFDTEKLGAGDYGSNQIYAALIAYKVQRDKQKAVILFA